MPGPEEAPVDTLADLRTAQRLVRRAGLVPRGAFHCTPGEQIPGPGGAPAASVLLVGSIGAAGFGAFRDSAHFDAAGDDRLDAWTEQALAPVAEALGARALYPHRGPPWLPFQRWACRAEALHRSPLGILIHPRHGLWHAWRGALAFAHRLAGIEVPAPQPSPCESCAARPCLGACPAGAFSAQGFDAAACTAHLAAPEGAPCMQHGCLARRACPVAPGLRYRGEQARFHMSAFLRSAERSDP